MLTYSNSEDKVRVFYAIRNNMTHAVIAELNKNICQIKYPFGVFNMINLLFKLHSFFRHKNGQILDYFHIKSYTTDLVQLSVVEIIAQLLILNNKRPLLSKHVQYYSFL